MFYYGYIMVLGCGNIVSTMLVVRTMPVGSGPRRARPVYTNISTVTTGDHDHGILVSYTSIDGSSGPRTFISVGTYATLARRSCDVVITISRHPLAGTFHELCVLVQYRFISSYPAYHSTWVPP